MLIFIWFIRKKYLYILTDFHIFLNKLLQQFCIWLISDRYLTHLWLISDWFLQLTVFWQISDRYLTVFWNFWDLHWWWVPKFELNYQHRPVIWSELGKIEQYLDQSSNTITWSAPNCVLWLPPIMFWSMRRCGVPSHSHKSEQMKEVVTDVFHR